jgi:hypothetical protein
VSVFLARCLFVCLFVSLIVFLFVCLFVYLFARRPPAFNLSCDACRPYVARRTHIGDFWFVLCRECV